MSLIKFSDVIRDVNWPTVWRYEYTANTVGPTNLTPASANLFSDQDASLEGAGVGGWNLWPGNCTVANSTAQAYLGTHSLALTATANGDTSLFNNITGIVGNVLCTASARFKTTAGKTITLQFAGDVTGQTRADVVATGGWDTITVTKTFAGDAARYCLLDQANAVAGDICYWDAFQLTTGDGVKLIYTHTFTLGEISHIKCDFKTEAGTAAAADVILNLWIYLDGAVIDNSGCTVYVLRGQTPKAEIVFPNLAAGAHTVEFKASATAGTIVMSYYNAHIDVCRA